MRRSSLLLLLFTLIVTASAGLESCRKKTEVTAPTPVAPHLPPSFSTPRYDFAANPLTEEGIALGRQLFYEGALSADGQTPCGSCHMQEASFGTFDHDLSHGANHTHTDRNAPVLLNLAWQPSFGFDGAYNKLEDVMRDHLTDPNYMAETEERIVQKLKSDSRYPALFRKAFGDETITIPRMLQALSQFSLTLVSANSKYDRVKSGGETFTAAEQSGYSVFTGKCASCHAEPLFTDYSFRNIGLPLDPFLKDNGRMRVTGNRSDSLKFKVPTLRNVDRSFPYAHDGRLNSTTSILNHYRGKVEQGPTLDPSLAQGIPLSNTEVAQLVAFLKTLTDTAFMQNRAFSRPL